MTNFAGKLNGWLPIRMHLPGGEPFFDWCHFGDHRLRRPFFDLDVEDRLKLPMNCFLRPQTPVGVLRDFAAIHECVRPRGFIFHMTRCGSTLLTQMLAAVPENLVLSEPFALSQVLRLRMRRPDLSDEIIAEYVGLTLNSLGQKRDETVDRLFVKFDGLDIIQIDTISRAFPDVPWVFVYREPVEVIVSHLRMPSPSTIPGSIGYLPEGLDFAAAAELSHENFIARMLSDICRSALNRRDDPRGMFVNYNELPNAFSRISDHFNGNFTAAQMESMATMASFDAKAPERRFSPDSAEKRHDASESVRDAAAIVAPLYDELERVRMTSQR